MEYRTVNRPNIHNKKANTFQPLFYLSSRTILVYPTVYIPKLYLKWYAIFKSGIPRKNGFDSYGSSVIVDNSANDNICSEEDMFTDKIDPIIYNLVAAIGGKYIIPKGIVTVIWYWTDDEGQLHTNKLNTVLYFTYSSVNILSETTLSKSMKDDDYMDTNKILYLYLGFWGV